MVNVMRLTACLMLLGQAALFAQSPDPDALLRHAIDAQMRGNFVVAIADYRQFLRTHPNSFDARANLGAALAQEGRFPEAISEYRTALKLRPDNLAVQKNLGLSLYKSNDCDEAAQVFESVLKAQPTDRQAVILLGDCYQRLGREQQAVELLTPLDSAQKGDSDLEYVLASALIRKGRQQDGANMMEKVAIKTGNGAAYLMAASTLVDLNDLDRSRRDLDRAAALNPNLPGIHTLSGVIRDKLGDGEGAKSELRKGLDANPKDFRANLTLGAILYKERDLKQAEEYVTRSLQADSSSVLAHYEHALIISALGHREAAVAELENVVQRSPEWAEPHVQLSALYFRLHRSADGLREKQIVDRLSAAKPGPTP